MTRHPVTGFRLDPKVIQALDDLVEHSKSGRTELVSRLILDEHAAVGLGSRGRDTFVAHLEKRFGGSACIRFELGLGGDPRSQDVVVKVDSEPAEDLATAIGSDTDNMTNIYLVDPESTLRLQVGSVFAFGGAIETTVAALRKAPLGWPGR
jgi:hypothetical protein